MEPLPFPIATDHLAYWLRQNPSFDWHTVTESSFSTDFLSSESKFEDAIGTDSTDLDGFIDHKAKNITYHGTADLLIFSRGTINYFERPARRSTAPETWTSSPGCSWPGNEPCGGGQGANAFGNNAFGGPPVSSDPSTTSSSACRLGGVRDSAGSIIATKLVNDNPASAPRSRAACVCSELAA